jgi:hypothetical protein
MEHKDRNYSRIIKILRHSEPFLSDREDVENEIIQRIRMKPGPERSFDLLSFLFGWIYIGWLRRSLIIVSILMVFVFICQQTIILRQIRNISNQSFTGLKKESVPDYVDDLGNKLTIYKFSRQVSTSGEISIPDKQLKQLLESYEKLQNQYGRLITIIEEDPALKNYIEKKLNGKNRKSNI